MTMTMPDKKTTVEAPEMNCGIPVYTNPNKLAQYTRLPARAICARRSTPTNSLRRWMHWRSTRRPAARAGRRCTENGRWAIHINALIASTRGARDELRHPSLHEPEQACSLHSAACARGPHRLLKFRIFVGKVFVDFDLLTKKNQQ